VLDLAGCFLCDRSAGLAKDLPPVLPDGLKMMAEPLAPGTSAIILYRQVCAILF